MPKNESCQNDVLTIPLCRGGWDEHTGENDKKFRRRTWLHASARCQPTRATRLLCPDGLTRPEYQTTRPMWLTRIRMMSSWRQHAQLACHVSDQSAYMSTTNQLTRQHSGTHLPCHQPRAELSWAEPSRAASRGIGSSVTDPRCNRSWDWIWAVNQTRIVLIKS